MRNYSRRKKTPITKYNPKFRNKLGHYEKEEWTSFSDLGKVYEGKLFKLKDYLKIEKLYADSVILAMCFFKSKSIKITHVLKLDKKKNFVNYDSSKLYQTYLKVKDGDIIKDEKVIRDLIKLRLREHFGELELMIDRKSRTEILFGFDYYMYLKTNRDIKPLLKQISEIGLYTN